MSRNWILYREMTGKVIFLFFFQHKWEHVYIISHTLKFTCILSFATELCTHGEFFILCCRCSLTKKCEWGIRGCVSSSLHKWKNIGTLLQKYMFGSWLGHFSFSWFSLTYQFYNSYIYLLSVGCWKKLIKNQFKLHVKVFNSHYQHWLFLLIGKNTNIKRKKLQKT